MKMRTLGAVAAMLFASSLIDAAAGADMQAAVVTDGKLVVQTRSVPEPAAGEIRIKVHAAGVNPADHGFFARREGAVPGFDTSGVVDAVGDGVTQWKKGDAVIAMAPNGSYAQYVVAPINRVAGKPKNMSFEEAAGIPVVGETAYRALVVDAKLDKGQRILIHGGAGGVGSAAVQIAKARGAHVIATASPRNHEFLRSIGADEVIDYNTVRFEDRVKDLDVVLNTVDIDTGTRSLDVLKPDGILATVVAPTTPEQCAAANVRCMRPNRNVGPSVTELLAHVGELAEAGEFRINVDKAIPLADAQSAWDLSRQKHTRGKLVIVVPQ